MEVLSDDGSVSTNLSDILGKWQDDFRSLFTNAGQSRDVETGNANDDNLQHTYNEHINIFEVKKAVDDAKMGKAAGFDNIPTEVLKNDTAISFLHILFNICFDNGIVPSDWGKCVINPIPKSSTSDRRDPLSYRGISLAPAMYKLYCSVLNRRLSSWSEQHGKLTDDQNGFRKGRSTTDHILSLTNIIDTRKRLRKPTFCAFIDFRKAYDTINRNILWKRLSNIGISGKMFSAIKSLYLSVRSCVRVNSYKTDWFDVQCGLRQGCVLSPLLFNLFINDLAVYLKSLDLGISLGDEKISVMLYADDIVLLAESSDELQLLLNALYEWCGRNDMSVNTAKSNVIHFRPNSVSRTDVVFSFGNDAVNVIDRYTYLGVVLSEHLDYNIMAKCVAQSASRALGLLIAKCKNIGGVPYNVFTKLYDSVVWPVISYSAPIWGFRSYSCIDAVHNRAMRFFLGVGKYTPNDAIAGEMGWKPAFVLQWKSICLYWSKLSAMNNDRLNKRVALWALSKSGRACKNWMYSVADFLNGNNLTQYANIAENIPAPSCFIRNVENKLFEKFSTSWYSRINCRKGTSGKGRNKLRLYKLLKTNFNVEQYCKIIMPPSHRAAFSKFRCGVAPIRIETGRYEGLAEEMRLCPFCNVVENELHVILNCRMYDDLRETLYVKAQECAPHFNSMSDGNKFVFLFSNHHLVRVCAKTCAAILQRRQFLTCK